MVLAATVNILPNCPPPRMPSIAGGRIGDVFMDNRFMKKLDRVFADRLNMVYGFRRPDILKLADKLRRNVFS